MKAKIKSFHSPDVDLATFWPDDPEDVGFLLQVLAGPADSPAEESFDLMVVTPRRLGRETRENGPLIGRHHLIVHRYDWGEIRAFLTRLFEAEIAPTWEELGTRLGRIGYWEFEDYTP
jgi:hypothetical protein